MVIELLPDIESATSAQGYTVVIDILRAATVEAYAFANGAKKIIPVAKVSDAFDLKKKHPEYLLMGEEHGYKIEEFDFGNSPTEIQKAAIKDKILVHRTSAGTQGLSRAVNASRLVFGSFVTVSAIVEDIHKLQPAIVSIVSTASEDAIFAEYLYALLRNETPNKEKTSEALLHHPNTDWFYDITKPEYPLEDIHLALEVDKFPFLCLVTKKNGLLVTEKYFPNKNKKEND